MRPKNMGKHVQLWTRMPHSEIQIPCQNDKFKHLNFLYRYPISYKIAKKPNTEYSGDLDFPFEDITHPHLRPHPRDHSRHRQA